MVVAYPSFGGYPDDVDVHSFESLQDDVLNQIQQPSVVIARSMGGILQYKLPYKNLNRCGPWCSWQPQAGLIKSFSTGGLERGLSTEFYGS